MIKDLKKSIVQATLLSGLTLFAASSGFAATPTMDQLPQFLLNLGSYIGYDLNATGPTPPISTMADDKSVAEAQKMAIELHLGTILDNSIVDPNNKSPLATFLNQKINAIFKSGVFSTPSSGGQQSSSNVTVSALIDQTPYQNNPINQTILNSLTTPDFSYCAQVTHCMSNGDSSGGTDLASRCCPTPGRAQYQIGANIIGTIPPTIDVFNALDTSVLNQLNGNTLIDPLLYSTSSNSDNSGSTSSSSGAGGYQQTNQGLQANNQAQEAENFIRYVTGSVAPAPKTKAETYQMLYNRAMTPLPNNPTSAQITQAAEAQGALSSYLASLRTSAAQNSVGVGNLYNILSKRMLQTSNSNAAATSQALNEYTMATRRLYDPASKNPQWVDQINNASSATVQKEIAVLLSEINYQLYLTRQQQERLLLTNTVMLFQLSHLVAPTPLQAPTQ